MSDLVQLVVISRSGHVIGHGNDDGRNEELQFGADESAVKFEPEPVEVDDGTGRFILAPVSRQVARQPVDDDVQSHVHRPVQATVERRVFVAVLRDGEIGNNEFKMDIF